MNVDLGSGFRALVQATQGAFLGAVEHADTPVDLVLADILRENVSWRGAVFRHMFNYLPDEDGTALLLGGQQARTLDVDRGHSRFDLEFFVSSSPRQIRIKAAYSTEIHDGADIRLLLERYESLLLAAARDLDRPVGTLSLLSGRDQAVLDRANRTERAVTPATVLAAVAGRTAEQPDAVAVQDGDQALTYRQLWHAATANREALDAAGVVPGDVVAVAAARGGALAAAVLGVWLTGAAYLPLDPGHPHERLAYQVEDSGARVLMADGPCAWLDSRCERLPLAAADPAAAAEAAPDLSPGLSQAADRAYLIYTSGSTGRPKGVELSHGNLANVVGHFADSLSVASGDAVLWLTTFAFDISALELFLPLARGGRVVVAPDEARTDATVLFGLVHQHDVRVVQATPTTWRLVVDEADGRLAGRQVLCGGEAMPSALAGQLLRTGCSLHNVYGPTETTVWSTAAEVREEPAGRWASVCR
ncbi:AMP-binding protein [Streptacidiphilus sp. 4-A2]|nr:AMP-binding protein [Streptacidiphilus sp. 4-A2]